MSDLPKFPTPGATVNIPSLDGTVGGPTKGPEGSFIATPTSTSSSLTGQLPSQIASDKAHTAAASAAASAAAAAAAAASVHNTDPSLHDQGLSHASQNHHGSSNVNHNNQATQGDELENGISHRDETYPSNSTKRAYDCHICGWRFALKGNLVAHIRRHTGEKPYICSICHRKFTQSSLLTVHMRTHTGEKPFKCTKCGRSFSRSGNLTTHMRTHNDTKPYECGFCHKKFSQRVNMELHTRIHTGVKPYRCGVCNRAFTSCSNMRRHWRHIHPSYPEPAMGTLHLLNGMPEKSLYGGPTLREPAEYRVSPHQSEHYNDEQSNVAAVGRREVIPPMLQNSQTEPVYSHIIGEDPSQSVGHMANSMVNPISNHHQLMSHRIGQINQNIENPLRNELPSNVGTQIVEAPVQIVHHPPQLARPLEPPGIHSHSQHQRQDLEHPLKGNTNDRATDGQTLNNQYTPHHAPQNRLVAGQYPIESAIHPQQQYTPHNLEVLRADRKDQVPRSTLESADE